MKVIIDLKKGVPTAVKIIYRGMLYSGISRYVVGRDDMSIMRTLYHINMVYCQEVMTYSKRVYLAMEIAFYEHQFKSISKHGIFAECTPIPPVTCCNLVLFTACFCAADLHNITLVGGHSHRSDVLEYYSEYSWRRIR